MIDIHRNSSSSRENMLMLISLQLEVLTGRITEDQAVDVSFEQISTPPAPPTIDDLLSGKPQRRAYFWE